MLDMTLKSGPKNFSMVFALAGDSTITKFFIQKLFLYLTLRCPLCRGHTAVQANAKLSKCQNPPTSYNNFRRKINKNI